MKRPHKYGAKAVEVDGIRFPSQMEARRYRQLKLLEKANEIIGLKVHPRYELLAIGGVKVCIYEGDFEYQVPGKGLVTEDVKGFRTALYKLKAKWFEAQFGRPIVEITKRRRAAA